MREELRGFLGARHLKKSQPSTVVLPCCSPFQSSAAWPSSRLVPAHTGTVPCPPASGWSRCLSALVPAPVPVPACPCPSLACRCIAGHPSPVLSTEKYVPACSLSPCLATDRETKRGEPEFLASVGSPTSTRQRDPKANTEYHGATKPTRTRPDWHANGTGPYRVYCYKLTGTQRPCQLMQADVLGTATVIRTFEQSLFSISIRWSEGLSWWSWLCRG